VADADLSVEKDETLALGAGVKVAAIKGLVWITQYSSRLSVGKEQGPEQSASEGHGRLLEQVPPRRSNLTPGKYDAGPDTVV
jgi:hypothetical protein